MVLAAVVVTTVVLWACFTAQRLNRLHIRTDAARITLKGALDRRAAVAAALDPSLVAACRRAEATGLGPGDMSARVAAENELTDLLAASPAAAHPQIADAEARVALAHRFYNDAVTDTRAVRTRALVRLLRLGGTAPLPAYCELAVATHRTAP
nr:hypothetical protein [Corynebacterium mendelii]